MRLAAANASSVTERLDELTPASATTETRIGIVQK
jgi:hypothetical protein